MKKSMFPLWIVLLIVSFMFLSGGCGGGGDGDSDGGDPSTPPGGSVTELDLIFLRNEAKSIYNAAVYGDAVIVTSVEDVPDDFNGVLVFRAFDAQDELQKIAELTPSVIEGNELLFHWPQMQPYGNVYVSFKDRSTVNNEDESSLVVSNIDPSGPVITSFRYENKNLTLYGQNLAGNYEVFINGVQIEATRGQASATSVSYAANSEIPSGLLCLSDETVVSNPIPFAGRKLIQGAIDIPFQNTDPLRALWMGEEVDIDSASAFSVPVNTYGISLVTITAGDARKPMLYSLAHQDDTTISFNSHSTATALVWLNMGGQDYKTSAELKALREQVRNLPSVQTLAGAIESVWDSGSHVSCFTDENILKAAGAAIIDARDLLNLSASTAAANTAALAADDRLPPIVTPLKENENEKLKFKFDGFDNTLTISPSPRNVYLIDNSASQLAAYLYKIEILNGVSPYVFTIPFKQNVKFNPLYDPLYEFSLLYEGEKKYYPPRQYEYEYQYRNIFLMLDQYDFKVTFVTTGNKGYAAASADIKETHDLILGSMPVHNLIKFILEPVIVDIAPTILVYGVNKTWLDWLSNINGMGQSLTKLLQDPTLENFTLVVGSALPFIPDESKVVGEVGNVGNTLLENMEVIVERYNFNSEVQSYLKFNTEVLNTSTVIQFLVEHPKESGTDTWDGTADTSWYNETQSTFEIKTAEQLAGLAKILNEETSLQTAGFINKTVKLVTDIDLAGNQWIPIGGEQPDGSAFYGSFDGGGHTISNMTITGSVQSAGLFGATGSPGTVKNVNMTNVNINISDANFAGAGSIAASGSEISNCTSSGSISVKAGQSSTVGGIVGSGGGISKCTSNVNLYANGNGSLHNTYAGGIIGMGGNVSNCTSSGSVYSSWGAGGIVGDLAAGFISECESTATISGTEVGGIVGYIDGDGEVINCRKPSGKVIYININDPYMPTNYRGGGIIGMIFVDQGRIDGNTFNRAATGVQWGIGYRYDDNGSSDFGCIPY